MTKVKSKVLEIMALALEFNGKPTKQELTGSHLRSSTPAVIRSL